MFILSVIKSTFYDSCLSGDEGMFRVVYKIVLNTLITWAKVVLSPLDNEGEASSIFAFNGAALYNFVSE